MSRKNKQKIKGRRLKPLLLKKHILKLLTRHPKERFSPKQVIKKLKINNNADSVAIAMEQLTNNGQIIKVKEGKFRFKKEAVNNNNPSYAGDIQYEGVVDMTKSGSAYILCEGSQQDVFISARNLNGALNGDKVLINSWVPRGRRKPEGKVLKVLSRSSTHFLGEIRILKNQAILMVDNLYNDLDIRINFRDLNGADDGDMVIVKIVDWGESSQNAYLSAKVINNLGKAGSNDIEMNGILINNGFNIAFPQEVEFEAAQLKAIIDDDLLSKRRDYRNVTTFTIDPDTAKDFDDALSIKHLENGNLEIGVHIADVTHFVKPDTLLDKEAYHRSTSVYLVDRVAPMLPEKLSNELCSLRPNEDKFTFSVIFEFDANKNIQSQWIGKTLTHSDRRFTYSEAQERIESKEGDFAKEIIELNEIAKKLRDQRYKEGSISFEAEELKFRLDEDGKPIELYVKERKEAHMLVEDFMLLANKTVALYIDKKANGQEIPFVYRVHDGPDPAKLADFANFAKELGFKMELSTPDQIVRSFNRLTAESKENELLKLLEPLAIRTMSKAIYTTDNIGHYGLGFNYYAHFTSPIRRYADVLVHRVLFENLNETKRRDKNKLEEKCVHISSQERKAMQAERESIKFKMVEFMKDREGQIFKANISGMIDKGIFVQLLENKAEGLIFFSSMFETFTIEESKLKARGLRSGKILKVGDELNVRLIDADLHTRTLEFEIAF